MSMSHSKGSGACLSSRFDVSNSSSSILNESSHDEENPRIDSVGSTPESLLQTRSKGQETRRKSLELETSLERDRASLELETSSVAQTTEQSKGVISMKNGKWGAQIYSKHERIWLGTFNSKREAIIAYDRASFKLKGRAGHRNSPSEPILERESNFQDLYTDEQVVQMIKDHSYDEKLKQTKQLLNLHISTEQGEPNLQQLDSLVIGSSKQHLFQKVLTVSDVGQLNRLVVPKMHAKAHFPELNLESEDGIWLTFTDSDSKEWKCWYKYRGRSQSYVVTKGWILFVKDKKLEAGDTVSFSRDSTMAKCTCYVTVDHSSKNGNSNSPDTNPENSPAMSPPLHPNVPSPPILNCMHLLTRTGSKKPRHLCGSQPEELLEAENPQNVQGEGIMHGPDINILPDDEGGKHESINEKTSSGTDICLNLGIKLHPLLE